MNSLKHAAMFLKLTALLYRFSKSFSSELMNQCTQMMLSKKKGIFKGFHVFTEVERKFWSLLIIITHGSVKETMNIK